MKARSRLYAALLIGCILIAVALAGAGCTDEKEQLTGMWVRHFGNDELTDAYLIFNDDGSSSFVFAYADGFVGQTDDGSWEKNGDGTYRIPDFSSAWLNMTCSVSSDGTQLFIIRDVNETVEFSRYNATLPALTPETTDLYKLHQIQRKLHQIQGYWSPVNASDTMVELNLIDSSSYGKLGFLKMSVTGGNTTYTDVRWEYDRTVGYRNYYLIATEQGEEIATLIHHDDSNQSEFYLGNATVPILLTKS